MTKAEQALYRALNRGSNSFEGSDNHADMPLVQPTLTKAKGNPSFDAQFDVQFLLNFYTESAGVYTLITPAALLAAQPGLATQIPAFLFGNSDFAAGFAKLRTQFVLQGGWVYNDPQVVSTQQLHSSFSNLSAAVVGTLRSGDLILPCTAVLGGVNYVALMVIRCTQVAYGTLLDAIGSDRFTLNMIRYIMSDTTLTGLNQYNNNVMIFKQSLFGKFDSDFVSPNSFKLPENLQNGIIDVPLVKLIDKQVALGTFVNYNIATVQWSIFVESVNKLA